MTKRSGVEPCKVHTWVKVKFDKKVTFRYLRGGKRRKCKVNKVRDYCKVCGVRRPKDKRVVRLVVLYHEVSCPEGFGQRKLHDCYLDSVTPGHRCVDPRHDGSERCPHIKTFHATYGWRTYRRAMIEEHVHYGVLHQEWPMQVCYSPLDAAGTRWYAFNRFTGQRVEVQLRGEHSRWTWDPATKRWTGLQRDTTRWSPEGERIEQEYTNSRIANPNDSGMVRFNVTTPLWRGVPPRDEWPLCTCINCLEFRRRHIGEPMTTTEFETFSGLHIFGAPPPDKPLLKPAEIPSAGPPKPTGDPVTCLDCRYARCRIHRMVVKPKDPRTIAVSRTTPMIDLRTGKTVTPSDYDGKTPRRPPVTPPEPVVQPPEPTIMTHADALTNKLKSVTAPKPTKPATKTKTKPAKRK